MLRLLHDFRRRTKEGEFVSILSPQLLAEKSRDVLLVVRRSMTCQGLNESLHDVRDGRRGISFSVVVLDCVCVCLRKCGGEYCVLGVRIVNESLKGETDCENREWCVEERGKERYCWRAGVMSRNEGEEGEKLLV